LKQLSKPSNLGRTTIRSSIARKIIKTSILFHIYEKKGDLLGIEFVKNPNAIIFNTNSNMKITVHTISSYLTNIDCGEFGGFTGLSIKSSIKLLNMIELIKISKTLFAVL
jgi:hypothetical protein